MTQENNNTEYTMGVDVANGTDATVITDPATGEQDVIMTDTDATYVAGESAENIELHIPAAEKFDMETIGKVFETRAKIQSINTFKDQMNEQSLTMIGDGDVMNIIQQHADSFESEEAIKALSVEKIKELFIGEDGEEIVLNAQFPEDSQLTEFKRELLLWLHISAKEHKGLDEELANMSAYMEENEKEFNQILKEIDINTYIKDKLVADHENATGRAKENLALSIKAFDDAFSLDNLYETYSRIGTQNTMEDFKRKPNEIFNTYMEAYKSFNFKHADLTPFTGLEGKFLPEKYHAYKDLFLFAVIRMVAYSYRKNKSRVAIEGLFISQLVLQMRSLFVQDEFTNEERNEQFKANVMRVLDLFID